MAKKTIQDINVTNSRVLVRVDFNVPFNEDGTISDDKRITAALPTIQYLLKNGAKVILCSHLGRPKGGVNEKYSLLPVVKRLKELLPDVNIGFADDCIGEDAIKKTAKLQNGEILVLENLRFHPEEEKNDPEFAKKLASLADCYVSDAFGTVHRAHASTAGIAKYLPAVAGFLIGKELSIIGEALNNPEHPFVAILGGAKVSDKIGVIRNLINKCDVLLIGGGLRFTFSKALGQKIGDSLLDADSLSLALELLQEAKAKNVRIILPVDTVIADAYSPDANHKVIAGDIPDGWEGLDIGPETQKLFADVISGAKTVIWNGPMGVFEFPFAAGGTEAVAKACANCGGVTIIGGGDSASAVKELGLENEMTHISTGGGATLEYLEGKALPGVEALNDR